jgi:hypothetical protein
VQHVQEEHGQLHGVAQEGHVIHQTDQDDIIKAMIELQEVVRVVQVEVDVQHVQEEHGQLHRAAQEGLETHQIDPIR